MVLVLCMSQQEVRSDPNLTGYTDVNLQNGVIDQTPAGQLSGVEERNVEVRLRLI